MTQPLLSKDAEEGAEEAGNGILYIHLDTLKLSYALLNKCIQDQQENYN